VQRLAGRIRHSEAGVLIAASELSAYPQDQTGGLVRILGRNAARDGSLERSFTIDGEVSNLAHVKPLTLDTLAAIVARHSSTVPAWVERYISTPWLAIEGTKKHHSKMVSLGRAAFQIAGAAGRGRYDQWLEIVKANSPELGRPSLKNRDRRNVLDHARDRAWTFACSKPSDWVHWRSTATRGRCGASTRRWSHS
jgi:hypothetical protein